MRMGNNNGKKRPMITFTKYTPYMAADLENLVDAEGNRLKVGPVVALCRCGQSKMKPYCDGSHGADGIDGEKQEGRKKDKVLSYKGEEITIHDNRGVCSHDGSCWRCLPTVFNKDMKFKWINPDGDSVKKIVETIELCPSGALSYSIGGTKCQDLLREPRIKAAKDGPLEITGFIGLKDDQGSTPQSKEHYTLCRCGASKNKPFCDGGHKKAGFSDDD
jgi:CDGSH-type Zn-finger protein